MQIMKNGSCFTEPKQASPKNEAKIPAIGFNPVAGILLWLAK
ncbi:hypothetical protein [Loigolactobacillus backii]|nr:hypothetical protein [Loigolactobacillus backii]